MFLSFSFFGQPAVMGASFPSRTGMDKGPSPPFQPAAKVLQSKRPDLSRLLTQREKQVIKTLNQEYRRRWKRNPQEDQDLVYYLGDNAKRKCWSAVSGRIPTLRMSGGLTWSVHRKRFLTGREKLGTLGFPVTPSIAKKLKVSTLPVLDVARANSVAGNCMHFTQAAIIQLAALSSYSRSSVKS